MILELIKFIGNVIVLLDLLLLVSGSSFWIVLPFHKPPGQKTQKEIPLKHLKTKLKLFLSHIAFCLEDDNYNPVNFNGETISFTCQIKKT